MVDNALRVCYQWQIDVELQSLRDAATQRQREKTGLAVGYESLECVFNGIRIIGDVKAEVAVCVRSEVSVAD